MNRFTQKDLEISGSAAALLPPALIDETGWDVLLALHSDRGGQLGLEKLAAIASIHRMKLGYWLDWLESHHFVAAANDKYSGELRAILTGEGRNMIDDYLSAIGKLSFSASH